MCEVRSQKNNKKQTPKIKKYNGQQPKEMDSDEPYMTWSKKMQLVQWTVWPTGALVATDSLWSQIPFNY
jgi:hypothetical protein